MNNLNEAARQLKRRPGLSVVIVASLAIGIGVTTGIFSLFHQILIRPLPVPEPERLVNVTPSGNPLFSYPMFRDLEAQQNVFTGFAASSLDIAATLAEAGGGARSGTGVAVSGEYFEVLGLRPAVGRLIGPQDEPALDGSRVVVLSYYYWQSDFGGDPDVVGRTLMVNGQALTIVGVAPGGFSGTVLGVRPHVFVPLTLWFLLSDLPRSFAQNRSLAAIGRTFARLRPDIGLEQASAAINGLHSGIIDDLEADRPFPQPDRTIMLEPGAKGHRAEITGPFAQPLALLLGVTLVVLLVVCSNVANLLLARGTARADEMAIRAAIGAGRGRLVSQSLTEAALLALIGGVTSLAVAWMTLRAIASFVPAAMADELGADLSFATILFAAGVSLSTVLVFGAVPAIQASRSDSRLTVRHPASHSAAARSMAGFRNLLTISQIAFSVVLLVLAGLFAQSLANIARLDLGIDVDSIVTFSVAPRRSGYEPERVAAAYERIEDALAVQPGVSAVASATVPLVTGRATVRRVQGFDVRPDVDPDAALNELSPGFFRTVGVPLLAGRDFADTDTANSPRVVIVNESFARRFNLGDDVIGRRFRTGPVDFEIVGLVADAAFSGSGVKQDVPPQFYAPLSQGTSSLSQSRFFYVRAGNPDALMLTIPRIVADVDPDLPVEELRTMEAQFQNDVYIDRLVTALAGGFAILATLLAAIGLYGMLSHTVAQRTRELGVRVALGAMPGRLQAMVLRHVGVMTLIGCAAGVTAAIALGRAVEALLFGVSGGDPVPFVAAVAVLCAVVLAAAYVPARRASSIAPMEALRYE